MDEMDIPSVIQALAMTELPTATSYALVCYLLGERLKGLQTVVVPIGPWARWLNIQERALLAEVEALSSWGIVKAQKSSQGDWLALGLNENQGTWAAPLRPPLETPKNHLGDAKNICPLGKSEGIKGTRTPLKPVPGGSEVGAGGRGGKTIGDGPPGKWGKRGLKRGVSHLATYRRKTFRRDTEFRTLLAEKVESLKAHRPLTPDEGALIHVLLNHIRPREQLYHALKAIHRYPGLHETLIALKLYAQKPSAAPPS